MVYNTLNNNAQPCFVCFSLDQLPIYTFQRLAYARVYETYINNIRDELCRNKRFLCKQC